MGAVDNILFSVSYMKTALWSSTDDKDTPLEDNYTDEGIAAETRAAMIKDCDDFLAKADLPCSLMGPAGHDFWLTRNGHGVGFWARPEVYGEEKAKELTALAESFGHVDLYVGDDGRIYA